MKKVLVLAYIYPPLGGSGVQRTLKFTKYLPEFGWQPFVVCGDNPDSIANGLDPSLLAEIPESVWVWRRPHIHPLGLRRRVYRLLGMKPAVEPAVRIDSLPEKAQIEKQPVPQTPLRRLLQALAKLLSPLENPPVDAALYWALAVVPGCLHLIRREKIDMIYSSSFPYSDHLAAWLLKRLTGLPWVADFRDPWTQNPFHRNSGWRLRVDRWVEKKVLQAADRVVCITPVYTAGLRNLVPNRPANGFVTIENGYDPEDFPPISPSLIRAESDVDRVEVAHIGLLYDGTTLPVLKALEGLGDFCSRIRCRFVGGLAEQENGWLLDHSLSACIEVTPRLEHRQALAIMRQSDLLLLLIRDGPSWTGHYPGKIFEYMASGVPILLVGPDGAAAELVRRSGTGCCFQSKDIETISNLLQLLTEDSEEYRSRYYRPQQEVISSFDRQFLTRKLSGIFGSVTRS